TVTLVIVMNAAHPLMIFACVYRLVRFPILANHYSISISYSTLSNVRCVLSSSSIDLQNQFLSLVQTLYKLREVLLSPHFPASRSPRQAVPPCCCIRRIPKAT